VVVASKLPSPAAIQPCVASTKTMRRSGRPMPASSRVQVSPESLLGKMRCRKR